MFSPLYPQENNGTCALIGLYQLCANNDPDLSPYATLFKHINLQKFADTGIGQILKKFFSLLLRLGLGHG
jgi:hypothetical protein